MPQRLVVAAGEFALAMPTRGGTMFENFGALVAGDQRSLVFLVAALPTLFSFRRWLLRRRLGVRMRAARRQRRIARRLFVWG